MSEEQKMIVDTFPKADRGLFEEEEPVESDPLHAAVLKRKLKQKEKQSEKEKRKVRFEGDASGSEENDEEEHSDMEEDDEDEEVVDSEEDEEIKESLEKIKNKQNLKANLEEIDANKAAIVSQKFKAAEGVKFTEYDEYGLPKNDGFDYKKYIVEDDRDDADMVIPAPPEMIQ